MNIPSDVIVFRGKNPGKTTVVMAGVHGDEKSGVIALQNIQKKLFVSSGIVYLIIANPKALAANQSYLEKNMNRSFLANQSGSTTEELRVQELLPILEQAEYLLDLHNTTRKNSEPFVITEYSELGKLFEVKRACGGFDDMHPGGSDGYMNRIGRVGICLECGSIYDPNGIALAEKSIENFLRWTGNVEGLVECFDEQEYFYFNEIYKNMGDCFRLAQKFGDFFEVNKGELIGIDGEKKIFATQDGVIIFPSNAESRGQECFVLGKKIMDSSPS